MVQTEATGRKNAARLGRIKAEQAASGVSVNTGTPVDVQAGQREMGQLDTETVLNNAELHAYGYRTQAMNFEAEAGLEKSKASNALPSAILKATGGLLANAKSLGFKWPGGNGDSDYESTGTEAEDLAAGISPV